MSWLILLNIFAGLLNIVIGVATGSVGNIALGVVNLLVACIISK